MKTLYELSCTNFLSLRTYIFIYLTIGSWVSTHIALQKTGEGLPQWSSGEGSVLPLQEAWVPPPVRELDPIPQLRVGITQLKILHATTKNTILRDFPGGSVAKTLGLLIQGAQV